MTTLFMDPIGGNDANDGLTFANRKRSFESTSTAAIAGDAVRVIASPEPFSVGSATWTDNSKDIAWTNGSNLKIDGCDSGWVAAPNVTVSHPSTGNRFKTGTSFLECAIASGFTSGKAAYKTLGSPLNVAAFQQIALYFKTSSLGATMNFKIALCSDTTGDVIVAEVNKTLAANADIFKTSNSSYSEWLALVLDAGAGFTSTLINSVAIYINADPGSVTFGFDGLVCCKAPGAADLIDLFSLVGKNTVGEPEWYPVTDLSEAGLQVSGINYAATGRLARPYRGVTEAVTTYIRNPLVLVAPWTTAAASGSTLARIKKHEITIEGGWNRTDMSTQTGQTWICGAQKFFGIHGDTTSRDNVSIKNIGFSLCTTALSNLVVGHGYGSTVGLIQAYEFLGLLACDTPVTYLTSNTRHVGFTRFSCDQVWGCGLALPTFDKPGEFTVGRIHGYNETMVTSAWSTSAWEPGFSSEFVPVTYDIGKIDNNTRAITLDASEFDVNLKLSGTVMENNSTDFVVTYAVREKAIRLHLDNMAEMIIDGNLDGMPLLYLLDNYPTVIKQTRIGGDPLKNRTVLDGQLLFESSQTIRHTASGFSWRLLLPTWEGFANDRPEGAPGFPMQYVKVDAGAEVTVSCWLYIEHDVYFYYGATQPNPAAFYGLMVQPDAAMGLPKQQVLADMTIFGAWQQVSMNFTPSAAGVIRVDAFAYGGPAQDYLDAPAVFSTYYDDVVVTQAP